MYFEKIDLKFDDLLKIPHQFSNTATEIDYFLRIYDANIFKLLVDQTNLYARPNGSKNWDDTTIEEMKALVGVMILVSNYWSNGPLLGVPAISQIMSSKRYKKPKLCLKTKQNMINFSR